MALDKTLVKKIAHLARLKIEDDQLDPMAAELNKILSFVEQLNEVDTQSVEPMTSSVAMRLRMRDDVVTDGGDANVILRNAPAVVSGFFAVPKVVE
jgi:aspartyl-tRNA(Asn)/glutamyl-tRNA(Gln) amidotransferase subunit C